jgi:hypothetical protein
MGTNAYLAGRELVKQNDGTSGQGALAKCILSLYNPAHPFSIGEVLGPLDGHYTAVVLGMVREYAARGETDELREAGRWVYENFPGLVELSATMSEARSELYRNRKLAREEELRRLYPNG